MKYYITGDTHGDFWRVYNFCRKNESSINSGSAAITIRSSGSTGLGLRMRISTS